MNYCHHDTPLGRILLAGDAAGLTCLAFEGQAHFPAPEGHWVLSREPFAEACAQLDAYFAGRRRVFELPLAPRGTAFQQRVWRALQEIPYGLTRTYGEIAAALGTAARAVGAANARNPVAIVVPCHRVIGSDGDLTGYAGGLDRKRRLLAGEGLL